MPRLIFFAAAIIASTSIAGVAHFLWAPAIWAFALLGPLILVGLHDVIQTRHSLLRVYPVIGHGRYLMEAFRPEIQQYFVESNIDGMPFSREDRSLIYQRAKKVRDTLPFGTQRDVNRVGYELMSHSLNPLPAPDHETRVKVGGEDCTTPYDSSHLNISAMSFGSLSRNAVLALNEGAAKGGFSHNTGEGGISPYHLEPGGDLVWQVGTGYFGCRTPDGNFDPDRFAENAKRPTVRMVEIKLSQGAKPGHGGILPASKVTPEIASIRGVPLGKDVLSPPAHRAFSGPRGLVEFVAQLRELSGGKPVGFKLCVGYRHEFLAIIRAMLDTGLSPDFITVDGTEGGTGAAPVELSNSVGLPLRDGLAFVHNALIGAGLRDRVKIVAAGKVASAFDMFRILALGADICNSARAMMFALGCIQARRCNDNGCPVGVATQNPRRAVGLVVKHKAKRVTQFHEETMHSFLELVGAAGLEDPRDIGLQHVMRRVDAFTLQSFKQLYPSLSPGQLVGGGALPQAWSEPWEASSAA